MALVSSDMLALGTTAPDFTLHNVISDKKFELNMLSHFKAMVVIFMCNHCPYVQHILSKLIAVANQYQAKDIAFIAINSNDILSYPEDAPEKMQHLAQDKQIPFPYLFDETQNVAKAYQAACTPDFYVFNHQSKLVYRGRFDAATPGNQIPVTGADLCAALDHLLADTPISSIQQPSLGCSIKWKT